MAGKKPHKPYTPTPQGQPAKLLASAKHFIGTAPKQYIYIAVAAVVVISSAVVILQPKRTEAKFCSTLNTGMNEIEGRYKASSSKGSLTQMGVLMNNMSEFSKLLRDLNKVAPSEIEDDMKVVSEAWDKSMDDGAKNGATAVTNPLGALTNGLAGGIVSAIKNGASYKTVDEYASAHCGRTLFGTNMAAANESAEETNVLDLTSTDIAKIKPWESNQKGVVVMYDGKLYLINTQDKKLAGQYTLPDEKGRTSATDDGQPYSLRYSASMPFSKDFRYIAASLYPICKVSDRDCFRKQDQVAYYDLKDSKVTPTGVVAYSAPESQGEHAKWNGGALSPDFAGIATITISTDSYDGFDQRGLLKVGYEKGYFMVDGDKYHHAYQDSVYYDIASKTVVHPVKKDASVLFPSEITTLSYYENKADVLIYTPKEGVEIKHNGGGISSTFPCEQKLGLISKTKLLCDRGSAIVVIDISNIVNNKTKKDDPNSPDYRVGRTYYDVKDSATINVGDRGGNRPLSPDLKQIAYVRSEAGSKVLYVADLSSGESTKIGTLKTADSESAKVLGWR